MDDFVFGIAFLLGIKYNCGMLKDSLKFYRIKSGLTQSELASKLFVTRQSVSKWEQGINEPDIETVKKLSKIFNCTIDDLINGDISTKKAATVDVNRIMFVWSILLTVACMLSVFALFRVLPSFIPAHWTGGKIDRYGKSGEVFLHLISFAAFLITDLFVFFVCKKPQYKKAAIIAHSCIVAIAVGYEIFVLVLYADYIENVISFITCTVTAFLMIAFAGMSPKLTARNTVYGVRTELTMESDLAWRKVNGFAAVCLVITSIAIFTVNIIVVSEYAYLGLLAYIAPSIAIAVYHKKISAAMRSTEVGDNK